jgi:hypothetical protein
MNGEIVQRTDGVYEERFDAVWTAEYAEDPENGLWTVDLFRHDVPAWREVGYSTRDDCRRAAVAYYDAR